MKQNERIILYQVCSTRHSSFDFSFLRSVRDNDTVKHYRIRQGDDGRFFIARRITFHSLPELVNHYSKTSDGLCVNLRRPCVHVRGSLHR